MVTENNNQPFFDSTEHLALEFLKKLYQYTYGDEWYKLKGEKKKPKNYDIQAVLIFLAFPTRSKDISDTYPEIQEKFTQKYETELALLNAKSYFDNLHICMGARNSNKHQSEENLVRNKLSSTFFHYISSYLKIFEPFKNVDIKELMYDPDNNISYYQKYNEMIAESQASHIDPDYILQQLDTKYKKVFSNDHIIKFALDKHYEISGNKIKAKDIDRLVIDITDSCEKNYSSTKISNFIKQHKKLLIGIILSIAVVALAFTIYSIVTYNPYVYTADSKISSSLNTTNPLQPNITYAEYNPQNGDIHFIIGVTNNTDTAKIISPRYTIEIQADNGQKFITYSYEFMTKQEYIFPANSTEHLYVIVNANDMKERETGKAITLNSGNFRTANFYCF